MRPATASGMRGRRDKPAAAPRAVRARRPACASPQLTCCNGDSTLPRQRPAHLLHLQASSKGQGLAGQGLHVWQAGRRASCMPASLQPGQQSRAPKLGRHSTQSRRTRAQWPVPSRTCSAGSALRQVRTTPEVVSVEEWAAPAQMAAATGRATSACPRWKEMGPPPRAVASRAPASSTRRGDTPRWPHVYTSPAAVSTRVWRLAAAAAATGFPFIASTSRGVGLDAESEVP